MDFEIFSAARLYDAEQKATLKRLAAAGGMNVSAYVLSRALPKAGEELTRLGEPARFAGRQFQGRRMQRGDHFTLLVEVSGPGGMYVEVARTIVLGRASDELLAGFERMTQAQAHTLSLLRPGALPADIAAAHDAWMRQHGLPPETRLYAHGQGVDLVERPLIRHDETMPLADGMCLVVHPSSDDGRVFAVICDNYLLGADGVGDCLHRTPKQVFELPAARQA